MAPIMVTTSAGRDGRQDRRDVDERRHDERDGAKQLGDTEGLRARLVSTLLVEGQRLSPNVLSVR